MGKTVEIYLSNQESLQVEVDGVEYIVHAGAPPGSGTRGPSIRILNAEPQPEEATKESVRPAEEHEIYRKKRSVGPAYADRERNREHEA